LETVGATLVGTGAALGAALFSEQLVKRGQHFIMKFGPDVSFADLRNSPTILIGTSRLTKDLVKSLRFRIESEGGETMVVDAHQPGRKWSIPRPSPASPLQQGYSLVTRLMPSESGFPLLVILGMDAPNTQAAVEFLAQPGLFQTFAADAPSDWPGKSFQIVLHNTVHGNSPGSVKMVASHVW
jgi:hypothetical protein